MLITLTRLICSNSESKSTNKALSSTEVHFIWQTFDDTHWMNFTKQFVMQNQHSGFCLSFSQELLFYVYF